MDEMVTVKLGVFFTSTPFACTYYSISCSHNTFPVNKLPNKLAPNVPSNILKNPPLCSLVSFSIVLLTPFNKMPEFSRASKMFITSFISSCSIINLTSEPCIFFCILPSIADIGAVKPNGANTYLANGNATLINGPANLLNNLPKNPPDCINFLFELYLTLYQLPNYY